MRNEIRYLLPSQLRFLWIDHFVFLKNLIIIYRSKLFLVVSTISMPHDWLDCLSKFHLKNKVLEKQITHFGWVLENLAVVEGIKKSLNFIITSQDPTVSNIQKILSYVYCTVHHLDSWIKIDQLDVTCFIISLFTAQHVSKQSFSLHNDTTPPQPNHTVTPTHIEPEQYNTWNKSTISRNLLKMDVLTFETCWALNKEIIKQVTSNWSIFIQLSKKSYIFLQLINRTTLIRNSLNQPLYIWRWTVCSAPNTLSVSGIFSAVTTTPK